MYVNSPFCLAVKVARLATGLGKNIAADLYSAKVSDIAFFICLASEDRPSAAL